MIVVCNSKKCSQICDHRTPHEEGTGCKHGKCHRDIGADCVTIEELLG